MTYNNYIKMLYLIFCISVFQCGLGQGPSKIFFSSIPKCGTHLLIKCINLLTNKSAIYWADYVENSIDFPNVNPTKEFLLWHVPYSKEAEETLINHDFKSIFLYRDPRDQLISYLLWAIRTPTQIPFSQHKKLRLLDWNDLLPILIKNIVDFYNCYIPWIKSSIMLPIKFEELVGEKGGGSKDAQINTITKICQHLAIKPTPYLIQHCVKNLFGGSGTFREGKIGSWQQYFNAHYKAMFKEHAGQLLIDLGYETDLNW